MMFLFAGHSDKPLKSLISMAHEGNHICLHRFSFIYVMDDEYYGAAEPPVRCGESHLSGLTEPLRSL